MSPDQARREAFRILRDASASMRRSVAEAERLLALADDEHEEQEVSRRRELEALEPEFFVAGVLQ